MQIRVLYLFCGISSSPAALKLMAADEIFLALFQASLFLRIRVLSRGLLHLHADYSRIPLLKQLFPILLVQEVGYVFPEVPDAEGW